VKKLLFNARVALLLMLALSAFAFTACSTTEDTDNASVRPWNTPKGWETGLPSNMTEGR
jgi:hypothetical protein